MRYLRLKTKDTKEFIITLIFFIAANKPLDASTRSTHGPSAKLSKEASNVSAMSRTSFVLDDKMDENTSPII